MERIEEELFETSMEFHSGDPYAASIQVMEAARELGKIREKVNKFLTSGPRKKSEVVFTMSDPIDKNSRLLLEVSMNGESNGTKTLSISMKAVFQVRLPSRGGFVTEAFAEYYMKKILPQSRGTARTRAALIETAMMDALRAVAPQAGKISLKK